MPVRMAQAPSMILKLGQEDFNDGMDMNTAETQYNLEAANWG